MDLMWLNGYRAASVDAICEQAGAKKGSFYYFFKSKSDLAAAALEADWKKKRAEMDSIFSPTVPPLERFDRYFDFVYDRLAEVQKKCGSILGCPFMSVGIMDQKLQFFVSAVRDAASEGLIETTDPVPKAQALFSSYQGTIAQARIQNDIDLIRDFKHVAREVLGVKQTEAVAT